MRRLVVAAAALVLGACAVEEPSVQTVSTDTAYQHVPSGAIFPTRVGPFARTAIYPGRAGSEGVTVGYARMTSSGPMLISAGLEASPPRTQEAAVIDPSCREVYARRKNDIATSNTAVKWLDERDTSITLAGESQPVQLVSFDYDFGGEPMRGYLFVACHIAGSWTLLYRVTTPRVPGVGEVIAGFIAAMPPTPLQPPPTPQAK